MRLSKHDISKLKRIIALAEKMISSSAKSPPSTNASDGSRRVRRTGRELVTFRRMLKAERKKGASVAALAKKHGISTAYIYTL